jgi:hypothetical protein
MEKGECEMAYTRRPVKAESDGTGYAALSGPIRADDHIKMRPWAEFDVIVGKKAVELNADD